MAIDTSSETLISLSEAATLLPARRGGRPTHVSCLHRWTKTGCRGVFLDFVMVGRVRMTSAEAVQRFIDACTAAAMGETPAPPPKPKPATVRKRIEAAERRLARAGV